MYCNIVYNNIYSFRTAGETAIFNILTFAYQSPSTSTTTQKANAKTRIILLNAFDIAPHRIIIENVFFLLPKYK